MTDLECLEVDDPLKARNLIGVLASSAKRRILSLLIECQDGLTAKEIADRLGVSIPTILEHIEDLLESDLIEKEHKAMGIRRGKKYKIKHDCIKIFFRLEEYVVGGEGRLEELATKYIVEKRRKGILSSKPQVRDVAHTLNVDKETALMVSAKIISNQDWLIEQLIPEALDILKREPASVRDLAKKLKIDYALAALIATRLIEEGKATAKNGKIVLQNTLKPH